MYIFLKSNINYIYNCLKTNKLLKEKDHYLKLKIKLISYNNGDFIFLH